MYGREWRHRSNRFRRRVGRSRRAEHSPAPRAALLPSRSDTRVRRARPGHSARPRPKSPAADAAHNPRLALILRTARGTAHFPPHQPPILTQIYPNKDLTILLPGCKFIS